MRILTLALAACTTTAPSPIRNVAPRVDGTLVATLSRDALTIARIDATGVHEIGRVDDVEVFGWLDARTAVTLSTRAGVAHVQRIVDGVVRDVVDVPDDEWPGMDTAQLVLSRPPTVGAPPGVKLVVGSQVETLNGNTDRMPGVACVRGTERTFYPDEHTSRDLYPQIMMRASARWVQTTPPIYEVLAELSGPQEMGPIRLYFRACSPEPLDGYVWLPDGVWGSFEETRDHFGEGTWTFWRGTTPIGVLEGTGAIRPSR